MSLADARFQALRALGYTGSARDMLFEWLGDNGGVGGTVIDRWYTYLVSEGYGPRAVPDMREKQLRDLGYTGALSDMELAFWTNMVAPHNYVTFDGINDYLVRSSALTGVVASGFFTIASKFRLDNITGDKVIFQTPSIPFRFGLTVVGDDLTFTSMDASFAFGTNGPTVLYGTLAAATDYTVHVGWRSVAGQMALIAYLNGVALGPFSSPGNFYGTGGNIDIAGPTLWHIGAGAAGANKFKGQIGFVWMAAGTTADKYITDPDKFYKGGDVNLANVGTSPLVYFGGQQRANDLNGDGAKGWNDGFNQGTGGNFVMQEEVA
jgi:hypothetical protein